MSVERKGRRRAHAWGVTNEAGGIALSAGRRWGIVGGGMLGLTLAHRLAQAGDSVTVFEAAPQLGGLASAWSLDGVVWDRHYHVTLLSDAYLRRLLSELDLEATMEWKETQTGCYTEGELYPVSNTIEFLRFPPLRLLDKLRLGGTIFYGSKVKDWRRLEEVPVERWLVAWSGRRTFERLWLPLLRAKLGDTYREASAAFIWATIQRLYAARRTGLKKEMFGYVPGGYARILERFAEVLRDEGVELRLGSAVAGIESDGDTVTIAEREGETHAFDRVVVTVNTSLAVRMIHGLEPDERARLEAIRYQGIVCASLLLERPLSPYYLTYITDEAPFTAVVEMSAFVDRRHFDGRSLVYLPKYCGRDDPMMRKTDDEVKEMFLAGLERMYPGFRREEVASFRVSRVREVFAVPTLGYSRTVPPMHTSVPGVDLVTSAQIVNGTLNVNETLQLAERAAKKLIRDSSSAASRSVASGRSVPDRAKRKPVATLSIDLDNLWSYLKTHGDGAWTSFPSFLDLVVPRAMRLFDERDQAVTWFVVGKDAASKEDGELLASVADAGHEIGNHSFLHEPWLHRYTPDRLEDELARAEEAIEAATGRRPRGFRSPGFSLSEDVLDALHRRGYRYDASTLPTFVGPLARAFYMRKSDLSETERAERDALFGPLREGTRPLKPYRWRLNGGGLTEIPITTMPILRTPIHMSYLVYIAQRSQRSALRYLRTALALCRWSGVAPSLLLHSHDFVGADDVPAMSFFPGAGVPGEAKLRLVGRCIDLLRRDFDVVPLAGYADRLDDLRTIEPRFFHGTVVRSEASGGVSPGRTER
jgi:protoporphyrinogen oxidase